MTAAAHRWSLPIALLLALALLPTIASPASAAPVWAPADTATITPGVQTYTGGSQCTANFIFTDGTNVFIGQAAHCSSLDGNTETNGCIARSHPLGTAVEIEGASRAGTMVYNSWLAMQQAGESNDTVCLNNDFALVRIDPADHDKVNPSLPQWGGPVALNTRGTDTFEDIYSYGNSSLRFGLTPTSPKKGYSLGSGADGWTHPLYTVTPGIPGDSGSGFVDADGNAFGVLSTLSAAPFPASNNASDLALCLAYMRSHGGPAASLEPGTEPFTPSPLPV